MNSSAPETEILHLDNTGVAQILEQESDLSQNEIELIIFCFKVIGATNFEDLIMTAAQYIGNSLKPGKFTLPSREEHLSQKRDAYINRPFLINETYKRLSISGYLTMSGINYDLESVFDNENPNKNPEVRKKILSNLNNVFSAFPEKLKKLLDFLGLEEVDEDLQIREKALNSNHEMRLRKLAQKIGPTWKKFIDAQYEGLYGIKNESPHPWDDKNEFPVIVPYDLDRVNANFKNKLRIIKAIGRGEYTEEVARFFIEEFVAVYSKSEAEKLLISNALRVFYNEDGIDWKKIADYIIQSFQGRH
jgi:hypothetical protein